MEISVKDLIVPAKPAGDDLRSLMSQIAVPGALGNVDAFKELLNQQGGASKGLTADQPSRDQGGSTTTSRNHDAPKRTTTSSEKAAQKEPRATPRTEEPQSHETRRTTDGDAPQAPHADHDPKKSVAVGGASSHRASDENTAKGDLVIASLALPPTAAETAITKVSAAPTANPLSQSQGAPVQDPAATMDPSEIGLISNGIDGPNSAVAPGMAVVRAQSASVAQQARGVSDIPVPGIAAGLMETPAGMSQSLPTGSRTKGAAATAAAPVPSSDSSARPETAIVDPTKAIPSNDRIPTNLSVTVVEDDAGNSPHFGRSTVTGILAAQEVGVDDSSKSGGPARASKTNGAKAVVGSGQSVPAMNPQQSPNAAIGMATAGGLENETANPPQGRPAGVLSAVASPSISGGASGVGPRTSVTGLPASANRSASVVPATIDQVSIHIARAAAAGNDHITIKLKPASLGQIDVHMELTHDGRVTAVITADRSDTLHMLQRDARSLEKALADAGLKADQGALQFNLRGDQGSHRAFEQFAGAQDRVLDAPSLQTAADTQREISDLLGGHYNTRAANGGVDIRV